MNLKSIRWRLPLSYITIALVAALFAGALMLAVLRGYYQQQEREYLERNTAHIAEAAGLFLQANLPETVLADQVKAWSFLLQARVQIFGNDGKPLADSGTPEAQQILTISNPIGAARTFELPVAEEAVPLSSTISAVGSAPSSGIFLLPAAPTYEEGKALPPDIVFIATSCYPDGEEACSAGFGVSNGLTTADPFTRPVAVAMSLSGSFYGFEATDRGETNGQRSNQRVKQTLQDSTGASLGTMVLSEGPAYGAEIVASVARTWALASLLALAVAGGAGWLVSRRITTPVLHLTNATAHMADGDLGTRCGVNSDDEFGALGRSFDQMAERLEGLVETLRRFVADAAHELNTPITALQTDIELARTATPEEQTELLKRIAGQSARLQGLVHSLLDLSRLESKANLPTPQPLDLIELVQGLAEAYASRAEQAGINFDLEVLDHPITITGDQALLRIAIGNLLDNALKFTPSGGTVRLNMEKQNAQVVLGVEDTGIGIPSEDLPTLFERFHRGRNVSTYPGNGLGLAIVKAIAQLHKGSVQAENLEGGARFELFLPTPEE